MNSNPVIATPTAYSDGDYIVVVVEAESTTTLPSLHSDFERYRYHELQSVVSNAADRSSQNPTAEEPSISSQIASRRKLLMVVTVQLGIVCLVVTLVHFGPSFARRAFDKTFSNGTTFFALCSCYIAALIALHCTRAIEPWNWVSLALLTVCDVLSFIMIDVSISSAFIVYVLVSVWWCVVFMLAGASLTMKVTGTGWSLREPSGHSDERELVTPAVPGIVGLLLGLLVVVIVSLTGFPTLLTSATLWVVVGVVVFVCGTFFVQLSRNKAPQEFMRGVIYLHVTQLIAFVVVLGVLFIALATSDLS